MSATTSEKLPLVLPESMHRWFSSRGCVVQDGECRRVYVGGTLIGSFGKRERSARNAILIGLCSDPRVHLERLAPAFGITSEALRLMRRQYEREGLGAVLARKPGGSEGKVTDRVRRRLERLFEEGLSVSAVHAKVRGKLGRSTVGFVRAAWAARVASLGAAEEKNAESVASERLPQVDVTLAPSEAESKTGTAPQVEPAPTTPPETTPPAKAPLDAEAAPTAPPDSEPEWADGCAEEGHKESVGPAAMTSSRLVQHVGSWLLLAMLAGAGLYRHAESVRQGKVKAGALRIALDAFATALAIGQKCVEGVRRLATPSAPALLRSAHAPSASWVRRIFGRFARELGGARFHLAMATEYVRAEEEDNEPAVFYIDNHLRPYTGQQTIRKGWRMQDKRVLPGTTDYYVHDEDGRPVLRLAIASHDSLTAWLPRIANLLRDALGDDAKILLAFDRGGAFPKHMAELREAGFDFVTYERRPFPALTPSLFHDATLRDGADKIPVSDQRTNLGGGKGRVRRVALSMPDGRQVNLLAISDLPVARLYAIMRGRWRQENGFKHGVERWGVNQLDGRTVVPYPADTIIPNPARRRLDRALRIARVREGDARRELAKFVGDDPQRARWEGELQEALVQQHDLEALRPTTPKHAPLAETELADSLVKHPDEYKIALDTVRIACANVESQLACMLARHLNKPAQAKRALANLFSAPGTVRVGKRHVTVLLEPAGNKNELKAFGLMLRDCNRLKLALPGDDARRRLRFRLQVR
jgi:hypothetical protein